MAKRKILVWADSPTVSTGFAKVSFNVLKHLKQSLDLEIDVIGINYYGDVTVNDFKEKYSFIDRIIPSFDQRSGELFGTQVLLEVLQNKHKHLSPPYDALFTIQDPYLFAQKKYIDATFGGSITQLQKNTIETYPEYFFSWVGYFPVDGMLKGYWVENSFEMADFPVVYTHFGKDEASAYLSEEKRNRMRVIYHGTDLDDFRKVKSKKAQDFRKKIFGKLKHYNDDTFIVLNVNRNQTRKDLYRTIALFKKFNDRVPNAHLHIHASRHDVGGDLHELALFAGLDPDRLTFPKEMDHQNGWSIKDINLLYNACDVMLTTTHGEGWGLSITEAMAAETLVVGPNHTAVAELIGSNERGLLLPIADRSQWVSYGNQDNGLIRPVIDVEKSVDVLVRAYEKDHSQRIANAKQFVQENSWENLNKQWIEVFNEAFAFTDMIRSAKEE